MTTKETAMASIRRRTVVRDGREAPAYDVRFRDPDGKQRTRTFSRKGDADRFAATVEADKLRGTYLPPGAGRVMFQAYAEQWLEAQTFDRSTREAVSIRLRLHAFPVLGRTQLRQVKPSMVQAWLRGLNPLSVTYRRVIWTNVSSIFAAAVDDELLTKNPCRAPSVRRPKVEPRKVVPWTAARVLAVRDALPERYRIVATLAAGLGLRQGEVFGLSPTDVDFLRGRVEVRRQVKVYADGRQVFALPKGRKARTVPLPASVRDALAAHLAAFPARTVALAWEDPDGAPAPLPLVLTNRESRAINRNHFNAYTWRPALVAAGVQPSRETGCHALRHFYASALLDAGESIKAVSEYLGHADAGFTLRTYTHLMPASGERTRRAVDAAFSAGGIGVASAVAP
jgi:integrase